VGLKRGRREDEKEGVLEKSYLYFGSDTYKEGVDVEYKRKESGGRVCRTSSSSVGLEKLELLPHLTLVQMPLSSKKERKELGERDGSSKTGPLLKKVRINTSGSKKD